MIPILYDDGERSFISNGIGRLSDCISCTVTEERNGIYECEFVYPITGERYLDIEEGQIIYCTHDDTKVPQPFVIYGRSAPINGVVTFHAHHISYNLRTTVVKPFTASSITDAINKIPLNCVPSTNFTFWTDKSSIGAFAVTEPRAVRGVLGGEQGSLLDVYGKGDYEWDKFTVKLHESRGTDSGIEIRYGKNLINIVNEVDSSNTYNAIVPYWKGTNDNGTDDLVTLPEGAIVYGDAARRTAYLTDEGNIVIREENGEPIEVTYRAVVAVPLDMTQNFESKPTVAQLRAAAQAYLESSDGWIAKQNITVDFVQMWQTEEYKEYAPLQRARLCDTVSVYYPELGVEAEKKKVIRTTYNVLMDRYDQIELGDASYSYADVLTEQLLEEVPTTSMMDEAIQHATEMISGGLGGYVVLKPNANGVPEEILIMDEPSIDLAVNVIRMNKNGIGFSTTGYDGTFETAWTIDGAFVADFITTGTLNANLIKAGVLSDVDGNTTFNLATGELDITEGSINLGGMFFVNDQGHMVANDVNIGGFQLTDAIDGKYALCVDSGVYRTWIRGATNDGDNTMVFAAQKMSGGVIQSNFAVSANGKTAINPNTGNIFFNVATDICIMSYSPGDFVDKSVQVNSSAARMYSSKADVICNDYGLTLKTGRKTTSYYGNLYVTSDGIAYEAKQGSSSRKLKKNIKPVELDVLNPARLYDAEIIQFQFKDDFLDEDDKNRGKDLIGFIVEDLDECYPVAVQKEDEDDSKTWTWSPHMMIPPMLKLIQDQKKEIDELRSEIAEIKAMIREVRDGNS